MPVIFVLCTIGCSRSRAGVRRLRDAGLRSAGFVLREMKISDGAARARPGARRHARQEPPPRPRADRRRPRCRSSPGRSAGPVASPSCRPCCSTLRRSARSDRGLLDTIARRPETEDEDQPVQRGARASWISPPMRARRRRSAMTASRSRPSRCPISPALAAVRRPSCATPPRTMASRSPACTICCWRPRASRSPAAMQGVRAPRST